MVNFRANFRLVFKVTLCFSTLNSLHKGPVTRKMFPFDVVIVQIAKYSYDICTHLDDVGRWVRFKCSPAIARHTALKYCRSSRILCVRLCNTTVGKKWIRCKYCNKTSLLTHSPVRFGDNSKSIIFKLTKQNSILIIRCGISLEGMPQSLSNESTLVQVMAWRRQTTRYYLSQRWSRCHHMASPGHNPLPLFWYYFSNVLTVYVFSRQVEKIVDPRGLNELEVQFVIFP